MTAGRPDPPDRARSTLPLDALFVSPHADDAEIFCGGTVAKLVAAGHRVGLADLTRGELATNGSPAVRRDESLAAARALGVREPRLVLGLPDGHLDPRDPEQVRSTVELLRQLRPRLVFGPVPRDRHPDHEAAGELLRRAVFLAGLARFETEGAPFRPRRLVQYVCHTPVEPTFLVDVSAHVAARRDAVQCYRSQFTASPGAARSYINDEGFLARLEARLAAYGQRVGVDYAEPFVLEDPPAVADPVDWLG